MPLTLDCAPAVNYSLIHTGLDAVVRRAQIPTGHSAILTIDGFCQAPVHLPSGVWSDLSPALDVRRLAALHLPEESRVVLSASSGETVSRRITLQPLFSWNQRREYAAATAAFVLEHDPFVARIVRRAGANPDPVLGPDDPRRAMESLYESCTRAVETGYLYERGHAAGFPDEQYVRFPSRLHRDLGGTCIDWVLFLAAAALASGLRPVVILTGAEHGDRHALLGLKVRRAKLVTVVPAAILRKWLASGTLAVIEVTALTTGRPFAEALSAGAQRAGADEILWGVDIDVARNSSPPVLPLPEIDALSGTRGITGLYTTTRILGTPSLQGLRLTVVSGRGSADCGRIWKLTGIATTIGRGPHNRVHLADPTVAREHALLFLKDGVVYLKDLASSSGTFLKGRQIEPLVATALEIPCVIRFGSAELNLAAVSADLSDREPHSGIQQ